MHLASNDRSLASVDRWYWRSGSGPAIAFSLVACLTLSNASCWLFPHSNFSFSTHFFRIVCLGILLERLRLVKSWSHSSVVSSWGGFHFGSSGTCSRYAFFISISSWALPGMNIRRKGVKHRNAPNSARLLGTGHLVIFSLCFVDGRKPDPFPWNPGTSRLSANMLLLFRKIL